MKFPKLFGKKGSDSEDDEFDEESDDESEEESDDDNDHDDDDESDDEDDEDGEKRPAGRGRLIIIAAAAVIVLGTGAGGAWYFLAGDEPTPKAKRDHKGPIAVLELKPTKRALTPPPGGGLNAIAAKGQEQGPGAGIMVPAATLAAFGNIPQAEPGEPLAEVPDPALIERDTLPKVGADGRLPWQAYARPFDARDDRPRIAIIITGMGLSRASTDAAIKRLPGPVTLAFDPYAPDLEGWVTRARQAGHEVLVSLPMEPSEFPLRDPGPYALLTSLDPVENIRRLEFVLGRLPGYVGVISAMGSKFRASESHLRPVLEALKGRGLMFVDGGGAKGNLAPRIATEIGLPRAVNDLQLDTLPSRVAIDQRLAELEAVVRKQAAAVAIAAPYPATLERLAAWAATLEAKNLTLAPVSALADKQFLE